MYSEIGKKVKELRTNNKLTLKELSEKTGLSSSFISQLERGTTTIAIDSLDTIARVFRVPITSFFVESDYTNSKYDEIVTRKHERYLLVADQVSTQYSLTTAFDSRVMFPSIYELKPLRQIEKTELYTHRGEEFGMVMSGILTLNVNNKVYTLYPGDTYHIDASMPHNIQNTTKDIVKYVCVVIPDGEGSLVQSLSD